MVDDRPKYQRVLEKLEAEILSGRFGPGQKLPSEAALVKRFNTSRITITRAMRELQNRALIDRVAGSGSFVRIHSAVRQHGQLLFGLLIPDLGETEILDAICKGIASAPAAGEHALLWGHIDATAASKEEQAWRLCQQFIKRKVSGVFFAPLEFEPRAAEANQRILSAFRTAAIPVVLLDRRAASARNRPDLAGLNNHQAGYVATEHLISIGCTRIGFLGYHGAPATIASRISGYRDALSDHGLSAPTDAVIDLDHASAPKRPLEGFVCVNDRMAGQLMHIFLGRQILIPGDVRIVGIDDVSYAGLLPVPLTTVRQPCRAIGEAALAAMVDRIDRPHLPARDILLDGELVVRKSCGARQGRG